MNPYSTLMETQPNVNLVGKTPVDARIQGWQFNICEFAGRQECPDGRRYCKHFKKASFEPRCMYYRPDIKDTEKAYTANTKRELCVCDFKEKGGERE